MQEVIKGLLRGKKFKKTTASKSLHLEIVCTEKTYLVMVGEKKKPKNKKYHLGYARYIARVTAFWRLFYRRKKPVTQEDFESFHIFP